MSKFYFGTTIKENLFLQLGIEPFIPKLENREENPKCARYSSLVKTGKSFISGRISNILSVLPFPVNTNIFI